MGTELVPPARPAAWQAGLTLDNVNLRADAFEHLQLPVRLLHGSVGRVEAQVPWQALRSPVVIELSDVQLRVALRTTDDLEGLPAGDRAWAAKQAQLAAAELQALAGGGPAPAPDAAASRGVLWSLLQHLFTTLLNRLQLTVRNVHISFEVGGGAVGAGGSE